ncbi:MAG: oligosaccharide flippase family protein [Pseudomonadota bacterium]
MTQNAKSLKKNTIANFLGVGYTTMIGVVILPLYLQYLGEEAFGLVGFFTVLQAWMQLLDMGMSPMLSRQAARARGHNIKFIELKKLLRSLEIIFFTLALIIVLSILVSSDWIANYWLKVELLALTDVAFCIALMGMMIGLRFFSSLYRSGIMGMENQVLLNIANIVLTTLKFVGALLLLHFVTQEIVYFFIYQLILSIIELAVLSAMFYRLIPATDKVGIGFF